MTEADVRAYIDAFNANDFEGFSKYYADDVEFNLGDRKQIIGRQGIVDFYREVKQHIKEELDVIDLIVAPDGAALHCATKFTTFKDWPDFELWPTMAGDVLEVESIIMYRFENGKIANIKSGRYKP